MIQVALKQEAARDLVEQTNVNLGGERVRMGFHSLPSLQQLHLHVISQVGSSRLASCLS